jgi:hypothetical protein
VFRKPTTHNRPELAPERKSLQPEAGAIESPLVELGIGAAFVLLATLVGLILVKVIPDSPLAAARGEAVLSQEWKWEPEAYRFDQIYGQTELPAAYSFDFVYPRPFTLP